MWVATFFYEVKYFDVLATDLFCEVGHEWMERRNTKRLCSRRQWAEQKQACNGQDAPHDAKT